MIPRSPSLSARAILLVIFPLICQLVFIIVLLGALWQVQALILERNESRKIVVAADNAQIDAAMAVAMMRSRGLESQGMWADVSGSQAELDRLRHDLRMLEGLLRKTPHQANNVPKIMKVQDVLEQDVRVGLVNQRNTAPNLQITLELLKMAHDFKSMTGLFTDISNLEAARGADFVTRTKLIEERVRIVVIVGLALSIVIAVALAYLYAVAIKRPLERITANSRRLAAHQPLLPAIQGTDELAQLDKLTHILAHRLKETLDQERALIVNAADLVCSLDSDGIFKEANPFAQQLIGYTAEKLNGMALHDLTTPECSLIADENLRIAREKGDSTVFDLSLVRHDHQLIETRWTTLWSPAEGRFFCVVSDVTERKKIDRLKEDFVAMISHDLRSPLASISGSMELIKFGAAGDVCDQALQEVETASSNIERLIGFVNDLLDFQKLQAGKMDLLIRETDLNEVVRESIGLISSFAQAKDVSVDFDGMTPYMVPCDAGKIAQVIGNFLSNAVKFTKRGTRVSVRVETGGSEFLQVIVDDCGPGVPIEDRERIFEAFEQLRTRQQQGTGLGLAICKLVADAHGGAVGVESNEQGGARFWLRLPRVVSFTGTRALTAIPGKFRQ